MVATNQFEKIKEQVLLTLKALDPALTYHDTGHTKDVMEQAERIAHAEGIRDEKALLILKIGALYHDTGFLEVYTGHEEVSCRILQQDANLLKLNEEELELVTDLIMATKLTIKPVTLLQEILCDADLDYLGRPDFFTVSERLKKEYLVYKIAADETEWDNLQLEFLKRHTYYTETSRLLREPVKQQHYQRLLQQVS